MADASVNWPLAAQRHASASPAEPRKCRQAVTRTDAHELVDLIKKKALELTQKGAGVLILWMDPLFLDVEHPASAPVSTELAKRAYKRAQKYYTEIEKENKKGKDREHRTATNKRRKTAPTSGSTASRAHVSDRVMASLKARLAASEAAESRQQSTTAMLTSQLAEAQAVAFRLTQQLSRMRIERNTYKATVKEKTEEVRLLRAQPTPRAERAHNAATNKGSPPPPPPPSTPPQPSRFRISCSQLVLTCSCK
jgi:cell wall-associated NlpC family hydrolase